VAPDCGRFARVPPKHKRELPVEGFHHAADKGIRQPISQPSRKLLMMQLFCSSEA
jgi:hypothetical protein